MANQSASAASGDQHSIELSDDDDGSDGGGDGQLMMMMMVDCAWLTN